MHITITGNLGSGKSTICKYLQDKYGFEVYSTGKVQRELAREMGLSTLDMNVLMKSDDKYDRMIDGAVAKISQCRPNDNIIFDSRLAWNFVPKSFKVFLNVEPHIAAERVLNAGRGAEEVYASFEDAVKKLSERAATECERYRDIYNVDYMNLSNYDLVLDSSNESPEILAEKIYSAAIQFFKGDN